MSIQKEIEIVANTDKANKNIEKVDDNIKDLDKSTDKANSNIGGMANKFKAVGTAIKAAGIGILIGLFVTLKETLSQNQKVLDFFESTFAAVGIVVNTFADAIFNSSAGFEKLGKVVKAVLNISLTPMKLTFNAIKLAILEGQLAWEKSFFGGKDEDKIKQLNESIEETKEAIITTAKEALESGKEIYNNIGGAITEITTAAVEASDALEKVSIKSAFEQGKRLTQLKRQAEIAQVVNQGLIEAYDVQAEKLRQIRDDDSKSIDERTKANDELGKVLDKQIETMQKNANIILANASAQYSANKSNENYLALLEAQNEKLAINAQVEGFRSEQMVNAVALKKEEIELNQTLTDAERERQLMQLEFQAELQENEISKIEKLQEVNDLEKQLLEDRIEDSRELYAEGTQARADAEAEYLLRKQELLNQEVLLEKDKNEKIKENAKAVEDAKIGIAKNGLGLLAELATEGSEFAKGIAITDATISGIQGVQNAYTTAQKSPFTLVNPAYPLIQAGLAGAFSAVQIAKIAKGGDSSSSSSSASASQSTTPPSFNLVSGTSEDVLNQNVSNINSTPVKAYVISTEVTTEQQLDRRIEVDASI